MKQNHNPNRFDDLRMYFQRRSLAQLVSQSRGLRASAVVVALALVLIGATFHLPKAGAQNTRARFQKDLAQIFTVHEDLTIDPHSIAAQVRTTGRMSLVTPDHSFDLQLEPTDLRGPNYRAEETDADGVKRTTAMPDISTYKGNVSSIWGSDARFTVLDNKIEGMIVTPGQSFFLEPAQKYSAAAAPTDYLLYTAQDVRSDITRVCGDTLEEQISSGARQIQSNATAGDTPAVFSPMKVVEIATESDLEYTNALGGAAPANNDILSIMNSINAIYQRDIGMTFTVTYQHAWTTADPFGAGGLSASAVLNAFTNYWNQNPPAPQHDVSHLWTGKSLTDANGVAWEGVVCRDPSHAYGISDRETIAPFRVTIPAHELGHNFNASHCDGQSGCDNTIMVAVQNQNNTSTFCPFSVSEITGYVQNNSSCLTNAPANNPIDTTDYFVKQQYADFLNRPADAGGLAFWSNQINQCGADANCTSAQRVNTSGAFFLSIEFQQTGYLVERAYKTAFGDATGTSTFNGTHNLSVPIVRFNEFLADQQSIASGVIVNQGDWQTTLENNKVAFFNNFVQRQRFTNAYPSNMLPTDFVHTLNVNAGSPMSLAEETQEAAALAAGSKTRARVVRDVAEHQNLAKAELNRAFVLMQYFGYLRRNPNDPPDSDYTGYDFWLTKLNQFNGDFNAAEMVKAFITSSEYRKRFGTP
ncbi:MAG TPA: M12 family metallo-peptidase [Pyrinomonadaceae bacterium]|nr:M12 family metallo-peptidase [Pyrinomonadaceae bacterium]